MYTYKNFFFLKNLLYIFIRILGKKIISFSFFEYHIMHLN